MSLSPTTSTTISNGCCWHEKPAAFSNHGTCQVGSRFRGRKLEGKVVLCKYCIELHFVPCKVILIPESGKLFFCLWNPESWGAIHSTKIPTGPSGKSGPPQKVDAFFRLDRTDPLSFGRNFGWIDRASSSADKWRNLESSTNVEFRIRDGLGLFYMGSYITFHCIVCHYIPCEFSGLLRWDLYQPVRLLVTGIQKNKQSKIKTELVIGLKFFEGWFRFIRRWRRRKWRKVFSCEYRWHNSKVQINPRRLGKDSNKYLPKRWPTVEWRLDKNLPWKS